MEAVTQLNLLLLYSTFTQSILDSFYSAQTQEVKVSPRPAIGVNLDCYRYWGSSAEFAGLLIETQNGFQELQMKITVLAREGIV